MKKYLITAAAALALGGLFVSCTHDDFSDSAAAKDLMEQYEDVFTTAFGTPAPNQTWGFGESTASTRGTRSNPGETYAQTSDGINANANEWADAADAPHGHGGWLVPDPLTPGQKERVRAYFQANPDLTYEDPHLRHFFVQQVYTGGSTPPTTGNKEDNVAADGTTHYNSANMNLLTVGYNEQHINNFNAGTYSGAGLNTYEGGVNADGTVNVLNNGYTVNDFAEHHHADQIMLMVNIDDTECFGYHNTGCSLQKNDKAALVAASVIDTWAAANGNPGEAVVDEWNRSFLGFDFELYSLEQSYLKDGSGNNVYAQMSDGQNGGLQYVWDGENVTAKGVEAVPDMDITNRFTGLWNNSESKQPNDDGTITYHAAQWGGLVAELKAGIDFSKYESLVIEFAEATTAKVQWYIEYGTEGGSWNSSSTYDTESGVTKFELNFSEKYMSNLNRIYTLALQSAEAADIKISRIYLKGKEGESGFGNYLMVDGKKVPYLITNTNMYGGVMYGGKDEGLSDSEMKITVDGKECFNMAKIKELVDAGYLPVKDKNLRTWVKWQGGDGYFSDWIVTLTEAQRNDDDNDDEPDPSIVRIIAEDLTWGSENGDFDFNDVVFDVQLSEDTKTITITLRAAGGTLPLRIAGQYEVHDKFGVPTGTIVNTGTALSISKPIVSWSFANSDSRNYQLVDGKEVAQSYGSTVKEVAYNLPVEVYKNINGTKTWVELLAPVGKAAAKVAVENTYNWCDERQSIDDKYFDHTLNKGKFSMYVRKLSPYAADYSWYK